MSLNYIDFLKKFSRRDAGVGSCFFQIIFLSNKINRLTLHMKSFRKDFHSKIGLMAAINTRKKILKYLKKSDKNGYDDILNFLDFKK